MTRIFSIHYRCLFLSFQVLLCATGLSRKKWAEAVSFSGLAVAYVQVLHSRWRHIMFSWAYLKTQDNYTHTTHKHTGTSTHLQFYCGSSAGRRCPWLAHFQTLWIWFLQVFALPWICLHFCLFVAAASHDHKSLSLSPCLCDWLSVIAPVRTTQKPNTQLISSASIW